jgi:hypothetical protein
MPTGRVLYVPEATQGRLVWLGQEIPIRAEDVAYDARRPGTRVRFDLTWQDDDLRASNVRRTRAARARPRWSPTGLPPASGGHRMRGGSER